MKRFQGIGCCLALLIGAAGAQAQTQFSAHVTVQPAAAKAVLGEPVALETSAPAAVISSSAAPLNLRALGGGSCDAGGHGCDCNVTCLKPWKCEDLEMKPVEHKPRCHGCGLLHSLLYCPKEDENAKNGNGKDEKKEGKEEKKEEKKNGNGDNGEKEPDLNVLMQILKCRTPGAYECLQCRGVKAYGWIWGGFTANFDSPDDRINFGTNYNWRSNDVRLDQVYFVLEKTLDHEKKETQLGFRVDFYTGNQAPFMVSNGLFSDFTGFDPTSGYGVEGPASFRQLNRIGIDLPQFYVNAHVPGVLTEKGIDILVGKFWTLLGHEVYPGPLTEFYSHSYEIVYATPFGHTGALGTVHATDTLDVTAGVVVGSDVFEDNNDRPSYTGAFIWNSCDKRWNWTTAWITGPEQFNNNDNYRTVITSCVTSNFGNHNEWKFIFGGNLGLENNAVTDPVTGVLNDAEWYGLSSYLFYTVNPKLIYGTRLEWFRDDDGARTAVTRRPGFAANFYEVTLGATYKPYQNLRVRPELRFDWSDGPAVDGSGARPYNDLRDRFQTTFGIDVMWEF